MQALIVRPVMTGLLALIIAGLWGAPLGRSGGSAVAGRTACRGSVELPAEAPAAGPVRLAPRC
jgi:hypothetical protein